MIPSNEKETTVRQVSLLFSLAFFIAVPFAMMHTGKSVVFIDWLRILASPSPLITDYYMLGSLPATFLNASICCFVCTLILHISTDGHCSGSHWAGFFLVAAHCFYGLNFLNMWPPILGIFIYCRSTKRLFRNHIDVAMLSTAFGPFMSELMFRYPLPLSIPIHMGPYVMNLAGVFVSLLLGLFLGFAIPAMLPGAKLLHRGYNLYNAGLAFGLLGLFLYSFMYRTFGVQSPIPMTEGTGENYFLFCNVFFAIVFLICLVQGWAMNGKSFKGYGQILDSSGHDIDFLATFHPAFSWINLGLYGLIMVVYFDIAIIATDGAGWTGATCGVTLAAVSYAAAGQHPKNVLPILLGYVVMNAIVALMSWISKVPMPWTLSTQAYMNSAAFATGLCPFAGSFGPLAGILAGAIDAVLCISTSQIHGGLVLYNGGLTAGLTAVILTPLLAHYGRRR